MDNKQAEQLSEQIERSVAGIILNSTGKKRTKKQLTNLVLTPLYKSRKLSEKPRWLNRDTVECKIAGGHSFKLTIGDIQNG